MTCQAAQLNLGVPLPSSSQLPLMPDPVLKIPFTLDLKVTYVARGEQASRCYTHSYMHFSSPTDLHALLGYPMLSAGVLRIDMMKLQRECTFLSTYIPMLTLGVPQGRLGCRCLATCEQSKEQVSLCECCETKAGHAHKEAQKEICEEKARSTTAAPTSCLLSSQRASRWSWGAW
jgi:hypothetical protein